MSTLSFDTNYLTHTQAKVLWLLFQVCCSQNKYARLAFDIWVLPSVFCHSQILSILVRLVPWQPQRLSTTSGRGHLSLSFTVLPCESKHPLVLPRGAKGWVLHSLIIIFVNIPVFIIHTSLIVGYWPGQASKNNPKRLTVLVPSVLNRMLNLESWIRPSCQ